MAERPNQRKRTRKDLLEAASRLMRDGRKPSLDEVAEAALVSRATAYRYFPSVEALLVEASIDVAFPNAETLFANDGPTDIIARVERADIAMDEMIRANEGALRIMLASILERGLQDSDLPPRQNRRSPLIEAALAPSKTRLKDYDILTKALALILGTEAMIVCKDVLQLDEAEIRRVKRWAIRALIAASQRPEAKNAG